MPLVAFTVTFGDQANPRVIPADAHAVPAELYARVDDDAGNPGGITRGDIAVTTSARSASSRTEPMSTWRPRPTTCSTTRMKRRRWPHASGGAPGSWRGDREPSGK